MEHEEIEQAFRDYFGKDWEIELRDFKHGGFGWYDAIRAGRSVQPMVMRFKKWKCIKFGHSFKPIDVIIFGIKTNAINQDMSAKIKCRCCGEEFVHKYA